MGGQCFSFLLPFILFNVHDILYAERKHFFFKESSAQIST